ncbi:MAG: DUF488 domain-containing protein [Acidobacteria bacterium]|nr:DUF488 domain-containing protein [Acidobacteriota bacterium]
MRFFTTGYTGRDVAQLPALLDHYGAVLADIRFAPHSRHLEWRRDYLKLLLKDRYRHVAALGNRNYQNHDAPIRIHNLEIGLRLIESWETVVVLLCACKDLENCHRRVVKEALERRGHEVAEIADWNVAQGSLF